MPEVSRRLESKQFARPETTLKGKSRFDALETERYREAFKKCSCAGRESGFGYHRSFPVGEALYQFLATSKSRRNCRGATRIGYRLKPRLKILMPDTLVFNVEDDPQWLFTDKDGYVACTPLGKSRHVVEVFGDVRFEEDLVAVRKQSCLLPFGGLDGGDDPAALYSNGNNLSLVNTQDLRVITGATGRDLGGGGRSTAPTTDAGEPFLIQKFIKSKGPHAFIIRQTVGKDVPPTAWMISNRQPYCEEINAPSSLLLAAPVLVGCFATTPGKDHACSIARLGPGACAESAEAAHKVLHQLEAVIGQRLEVLVVDFTKDDRGRLWLLQVKAFRFLGCTPQKPFRLTAQARRNAHYRLRGEKPPSGPSTLAKSSRGIAPHRDSGVPSTAESGGEEMRDMTSTMAYCRKTSCGMCSALLFPEEVTFRMTTRMIRESLFHIWSRLSTDQVPSPLRPNVAAIAALVSGAQANAAGRSTPPDEGSRSATNAPTVPSPSTTYRNIFVCRACFTLNQTENLLSKAERRLGEAIRASPAGRTAGMGRPAAGGQGYLAEYWRSRAQRSDSRNAGGVGKAENGDTEAIAVDPLEAPKDLTLCRFLVVIDDILDVPQAFLDDAASRDHSLELSYEFLGAREAVRLESPVREGYSSTASGAGKGYDRSSSCSLSSRRRAVRIPVHSFSYHRRNREHPEWPELSLLWPRRATRASNVETSARVPRALARAVERLFSFLAEATPLEGDLPSGSGLDTFLSCQREIVLGITNLDGRKNGRTEHLPGVDKEEEAEAKVSETNRSTVRSNVSGSCEARLGLEQFRNGHISKIELRAPLLLSGELDTDKSNLILIRAFLGLERVRSNVNTAMLPRPLWYHRGIYVIGTGDSAHASGFHTCDPLPRDWIDIGRRVTGGSSCTAAAATTAKNDDSRKAHGRQQGRAETVPTTAPASTLSRKTKPHGRPSLPEETMEEYSGSVWGLCVCIAGVHRRPEGLMSPRKLDATRTETCVMGGTAAKKLTKAVPHPTLTELRGCQARCLIFGHAFSAETPVASPPRRAKSAKTDSGGSGSGLALGGLDVHAYIQCGVATLRRLFSGESGYKRHASTLQVELLQHGGGGDGLEDERVRGRCEVPLETLVDTKYIEGRYPVFVGCTEHAHERAGTPSNAHHSGGTQCALLELAVHLYRMGPMNSHKKSDPGMGKYIPDIEGEDSVCWKPPSLVEVGQIVGLDHVDGSSSTIRLFGRPPIGRKS